MFRIVMLCQREDSRSRGTSQVDNTHPENAKYTEDLCQY